MAPQKKTADLLKNSIFIGIGTIASKLIVFILVPLYSMWLTPEEYGTFDLVVTYITLCVPFATLQLEQAIYVNCISGDDDSREYYTSALMLITPLLCVVSIGVYCIMHFGLHLSYAPYFVLYFCSFAFFNLNTEYVRGQRKLTVYSAANVSYAILVLTSSSFAVGCLGAGIEGMLAAYGCSYALVAIILFIKYKPFELRLSSPRTLKSMLKLSIPLLPNSVSWWVSNVSNRTFINLYLGSFANGLFAVSCKIPTIVSLLYGIFNLAFQQTAFDSIEDDDRSEYFCNLFRTLAKILVTGCTGIMALVPAFYWLTIDESYWEGMYCIPLLLAGAILLSLSQFLGDILLSERKAVSIGSSTVVAAVVTVVLNAMLVPSWSLSGAAFGSFAAYACMFAMRVRSLREDFPLGRTILFIFEWIMLFGAAALLTLISIANFGAYVACALAEIIVCVLLNKETISKVFSIARGV